MMPAKALWRVAPLVSSLALAEELEEASEVLEVEDESSEEPEAVGEEVAVTMVETPETAVERIDETGESDFSAPVEEAAA